jgi:hypothetical protein
MILVGMNRNLTLNRQIRGSVPISGQITPDGSPGRLTKKDGSALAPHGTALNAMFDLKFSTLGIEILDLERT